jgi:molybdopterin molybdotransferase
MKPIGLAQAREMIRESVAKLETVQVPLREALNRVMATKVLAIVDSPSVDASLMDGYAVRSSDLSEATKERPMALTLSGTTAAGGESGSTVEPGDTLRVMTGAPIPHGADAVVPEEFTSRQGGLIMYQRGAESGANILPRGSDVAVGQTVARAGSLVTPGLLGMLAAAGYNQVDVVRPPEVAIIGTGDEVLSPGEALSDGKLYASNITTLDGWCRQMGFGSRLHIVGDDPANLLAVLRQSSAPVDAVITSGGAWSGDRDRVAQTLHQLGWEPVFHGVRMRPGKGVGFGLLDKKPVFMLPGGPSANLTAFLQLALPGLLKMAGHGRTGLSEMTVELGSDITGRHRDWTQFVFGRLEQKEHVVRFEPLKGASRLQTMAAADALVAIPEGETQVSAGSQIRVQVLNC